MKVNIEFFYRLWYNNKHKSYRFKANARFGKHCKRLEPASLLVSLKSLITTKTSAEYHKGHGMFLWFSFWRVVRLTSHLLFFCASKIFFIAIFLRPAQFWNLHLPYHFVINFNSLYCLSKDFLFMMYNRPLAKLYKINFEGVISNWFTEFLLL